MKKSKWIIMVTLILGISALANGAYHHMDEQDSPKFQQAYPHLVGTKLDDCALCHAGGEYEKKPGKFISVGSCQWCHMTYGYDGSGDILETINPYGEDYLAAGRDVSAFAAIETEDSDSDTYTNKEELDAIRYPGDPEDDPSKIPAPRIVYTLEEIETMEVHKQFMLMNTSRGGTDGNDFYAEYEGATLGTLLDEAGIRNKAESISVFAPDGWSQTFDLEAGGENYYVYGEYPQATYYYDPSADEANGGWVNYSAPGCQGRENGQVINNEDGLVCLLAYKRDGAYLDIGELDEQNKLLGEGPYRVVPPQKKPGPPDQLSTSPDQNVIWPYDGDEIETDHNAGNSPRTATAIRVEPLPEGTTDFNWNEGGWSYVDNQQVIIYGYLRNGNIEGVVTDAATGQPIEKAKVATDQGGYATLTDAEGTYELTGVVCGQDTATYTLTVSASGYAPQSQSVEVENKETVMVDFSLSPAPDDTTCPIEAASGQNPAMIELFRKFRDCILIQNTTGQEYVKLYYRFAPEVAIRIACSGPLRKKMLDVLEGLKPAVASRISGKPAIITKPQMEKVMDLLAMLKAGSGPDLLKVLNEVEADIKKGTAAKAFSMSLAE